MTSYIRELIDGFELIELNDDSKGLYSINKCSLSPDIKLKLYALSTTSVIKLPLGSEC